MTENIKQEKEPVQILVVDDIPANLNLLTEILTSNGYQVRPASSGRLALKTIAVELPDLILLDVKMPEMNGYEVCRLLKADNKTRNIPVIFISALDDSADKIMGFKAGAVDYITKPFQPSEIITRVETHLHLRLLQKQMEIRNTELQQAIGECRLGDELLAYRIEIEKIISAISTNFLIEGSAETDRCINDALKAIGTFADVDRSYVFQLYDDASIMTNTHEWCADGIAPQIDMLQKLPVGVFPWWIEKLKKHENIHISRIADLPPEACSEKEILEKQGIQSLAVVPMIRGNSLIGFLGFDSVRAGKVWAEEDISLLKTVGELFVNALDRKQSDIFILQSRQQLIKQQKTITNLIKSDIFADTESGRTIKCLMEAAAHQMDVGRVSLWRFTKNRSAIHCVDLYELDKNLHTSGMELITDDYPAYFEAISAGEAIIADNALSHPHTREFSEKYLVPLGITSMLDVPVHLYGKLEGIICHEHVGKPITWTPEQHLFAISIANLTSLALEQSERKKLEEEKQKLQLQLLQSQKIDAVGQLAGGIAHDFNNILTAIIGYGQIMQMKMKNDDLLRPNLDQIIGAAHRAATLTQNLLAFSRKQILNPKFIYLNDHLKNFSKFLLRLVKEDIELKIICSDEKIIIMADSGQIEQALMNLVTNARDAMPDGGMLTIRTELVYIDDNFIKTYGYGKAGKYAVICIEDTGTGMDVKTKERVFEPFFTTKGVGKGTGLGLSMVYGIVKQHDGFVNVYSEPDKGSVFKVYLPAVKPAAEIEKAEKTEPEPIKGGTETILVAEDDVTLRELARIVLTDVGYDVIEARDGEDAVKKFMENKDRIHLVILDVIMPKKNGSRVYEEISAIRPDVRAIFVSGYAVDIFGSKGIPKGNVAFISKPVSPRDLSIKVRELLEK